MYERNQMDVSCTRYENPKWKANALRVWEGQAHCTLRAHTQKLVCILIVT